MTAGELAAKFDLAWPTMPGHFAVLREADLTQADKVGTTIHYRLNVSVLEEALLALMDGLGVNPRRTERTASGATIRTDDPSMAKLTNLGNARPIP